MRRLTVQMIVTVRPELEHLGADGIGRAIMAALEVGLEGAADTGVDAPQPGDVVITFVDDADEEHEPSSPDGYVVRGRNADGLQESYPADDVLRRMDVEGWPVITLQSEALETARCALIESEGWQVAHVYAVDANTEETIVASVHRPAPEPVVWIEVAGGPRLGYPSIRDAINALEDEERETRLLAAPVELES